jgi:ABC-2 type transport system permease protein
MLARLRALVIKELLALWRDRQTRVILLVVPILELLVLSFAATQEVRNVELAVLNQDWGLPARELVARFEGSPTFVRIRHLQSVSEIAPAIDSQTVMAVLHIGPDFSRKVAGGGQAEVQLLLDGRRSNTAQILQGYALSIVDGFNRELAPEHGPRPASVVVARVWFNPNLAPLWSSVPGLFALLTTTVGIMVSVLTVARERELGTFDQLLVSPLAAVEILLGKTLAALAITLAASTMMLLASVFILGVPFEGSVLALYAGIIVFLTAIIGVGLFISSLASTQQQAVVGSFVFMAPAFLLSGFASPVQNMPVWLRWLAEADPVRHFVVIAKGVFLKEIPLDVMLNHMWPMALIAAFTLSAGAWLFRHQLA